jgi:hypothetical protein
MKQSRKASLAEIVISVAIGFVVSLIAQELVDHSYGLNLSHVDNLMIVVIFTVLSIIRGYCVRRLFEHLRVKNILA